MRFGDSWGAAIGCDEADWDALATICFIGACIGEGIMNIALQSAWCSDLSAKLQHPLLVLQATSAHSSFVLVFTNRPTRVGTCEVG